MTDPVPRDDFQTGFGADGDHDTGVDNLAEDEVASGPPGAPLNPVTVGGHRYPEEDDRMNQGICHPLPEHSVVEVLAFLGCFVELGLGLSRLLHAVSLEKADGDRW